MRKSQCGQALAEFVVVVPLLLLMLMATVGFGHMIFTRMIVVQAANRAARLGAVLYGDSTVSRDDAYSRTRQAALSVLGSGLGGTDGTVIIQLSGDDIHVIVRYQSNVFVPFLRPWLGDKVQAEHESIYRIESDSA